MTIILVVYVVVFLVSCFPERKRVTRRPGFRSVLRLIVNVLVSSFPRRLGRGWRTSVRTSEQRCRVSCACMYVCARNDFPPRRWPMDGRVARADRPRGYVCPCVRVPRVCERACTYAYVFARCGL